jgi:hypothetical protein
LSEQPRNHRFQCRQFVLNHVPHELQVDAPVPVDDPVAESYDPGPGNVSCVVQGRRQAAGGFADDLEVSHHRILDQPLAHEFLAAFRDIGLDRGDGVGDVRQIGAIGFHSGVASASM